MCWQDEGRKPTALELIVEVGERHPERDLKKGADEQDSEDVLEIVEESGMGEPAGVEVHDT
tara:strand:+ start:13861 stop:14043 length:183 start_codon:yes stop_codon:yes gene_type:complete